MVYDAGGWGHPPHQFRTPMQAMKDWHKSHPHLFIKSPRNHTGRDNYHKILRVHGFKASMSGKGNCYDNAGVETFFKTIKAELIWRRSWETRRQAETAIFQYINGFYNPRRRHSALGGKSPLAFERKVA